MIDGCYFPFRASRFSRIVLLLMFIVESSRLLGMLAQNTNFGSDFIARVNTSGVLGSLLHSARHDLGYYQSRLMYQDCKLDLKKHRPITDKHCKKNCVFPD